MDFFFFPLLQFSPSGCEWVNNKCRWGRRCQTSSEPLTHDPGILLDLHSYHSLNSTKSLLSPYTSGHLRKMDKDTCTSRQIHPLRTHTHSPFTLISPCRASPHSSLDWKGATAGNFSLNLRISILSWIKLYFLLPGGGCAHTHIHTLTRGINSTFPRQNSSSV